jgi:anti-sigma-K factor RskA
MANTDLHDLTAGYALDALDPDERLAYEAHLQTCEQCRAELTSLAQVTGALAVAASGPAPAPELRERILDEARTEATEVVDIASRRRRPVIVATAVAGIAAAVAIGLGIWGISTASDLDDTRAALERERAAAAVLADPDSRSFPLETGEGRLVVGSDGSGLLVLDDLAPAPEGRTYQAWVVTGETPVSAAIFAARGNADRSLVPLETDVPDGAVVAVTVEQEGGADAPTTRPIATSPPV